jgi:hypothetical protein
MSGTVTTDYEDLSGTGAGPLQIKTAGVTATRKIENLQHDRMYFVGAFLSHEFEPAGLSGPNVIKLRLKKLSGAAITSTVTVSANDVGSVIYDFFCFPSSIDLTDVYVEIEYDAEGDASAYAMLRKVVVSPATYYNGLAWVWWPTHHTAADASKVPLGDLRTMAIVNNNAGKAQTFFRKAYNIQLPTADSPTVSDTLFGGS